jgi:hypothetical protein
VSALVRLTGEVGHSGWHEPVNRLAIRTMVKRSRLPAEADFWRPTDSAAYDARLFSLFRCRHPNSHLKNRSTTPG